MRFLYIGHGSLKEVEHYIHLAERLGYLKDEEPKRLREAHGHAGRTSQGLAKRWESGVERKGEQSWSLAPIELVPNVE